MHEQFIKKRCSKIIEVSFNELFIINSPPLIGKKSINPPGFIIKHNEKLLKIATKTNDLIFLNIHNMNSHNIQKNYNFKI